MLVRLFVLLLISACTATGQHGNLSFRKHIVHSEFVSEGVAVADVNKDGLADVMAGPYWFEAPDWEVHEITTPVKYDFKTEWSDSFLNFAADVDQDGWIDLIVFDFPGTEVRWFKNPGDKETHWAGFLIDSTARNESPMMVDIDGDHSPDLVFGTGNDQITWFEPADSDNKKWNRVPVSMEQAPGGSTFSHGLGYGDIDGDGKSDIITTGGWWKATNDITSTHWPFNETNLGKPCSQMYVYDLDLDGNPDVVSASAHDYGIWWHQGSASEQGLIFEEHLIDSSFSQTHGLIMDDLNEDGLPDLITGKRFFAHNGKDPGGLEPAVLYWYELKRDDNNRPYWIPHLIDDDSGVGLQLVIHDMNGDQKKDIVIANKNGVILFESY